MIDPLSDLTFHFAPQSKDQNPDTEKQIVDSIHRTLTTCSKLDIPNVVDQVVQVCINNTIPLTIKKHEKDVMHYCTDIHIGSDKHKRSYAIHHKFKNVAPGVAGFSVTVNELL